MKDPLAELDKAFSPCVLMKNKKDCLGIQYVFNVADVCRNLTLCKLNTLCCEKELL